MFGRKILTPSILTLLACGAGPTVAEATPQLRWRLPLPAGPARQLAVDAATGGAVVLGLSDTPALRFRAAVADETRLRCSSEGLSSAGRGARSVLYAGGEQAVNVIAVADGSRVRRWPLPARLERAPVAFGDGC